MFLKCVYSDIFWCQIYSGARYIPMPNISGAHVFAVALPNATVIPPVTCLSFTLHKPRTLFPSQTNPSPCHWTSQDFFLKQNMSQSLSHRGNVLKTFAVFFVWRSGPLEKLQTTEAKNQDSSILLDHFLIFDIWLVFMPSHSSSYILTSIHLFGEVDKNQFFY